MAQLQHHAAADKEQRDSLKAHLAELASTWSWPSGWCIGLRSWLRWFDAHLGHLHDACTSLSQKSEAAIKWLEKKKKGSKPDNHDIAMQKEWFSVINKLRRNDSITISKPDKGSGVVILNKSNYANKMNSILHDETKFEVVGPVSTCDTTTAIESRFQKRLLELFKAKLIPEEVYRSIRPTGSQRRRMYGLPKTHKPKVPLRPILSMTGSAHNALSKWLASLLQPVLDRYTVHYISDSFTYADYIQKLDEQIDSFMCSFDVSSFFTNVPLDETITICAETLYNNPDSQPRIPKEVFVELLHSATSTVEFSFDNTIYRQIDGVAMDSPLGPALANIFVGYYEEKLFSEISKLVVYFRYVDDTFVIF